MTSGVRKGWGGGGGLCLNKIFTHQNKIHTIGIEIRYTIGSWFKTKWQQSPPSNQHSHISNVATTHKKTRNQERSTWRNKTWTEHFFETTWKRKKTEWQRQTVVAPWKKLGKTRQNYMTKNADEDQNERGRTKKWRYFHFHVNRHPKYIFNSHRPKPDEDDDLVSSTPADEHFFSPISSSVSTSIPSDICTSMVQEIEWAGRGSWKTKYFLRETGVNHDIYLSNYTYSYLPLTCIIKRTVEIRSPVRSSVLSAVFRLLIVRALHGTFTSGNSVWTWSTKSQAFALTCMD